jgi:3-oxoacyl-[acyl-carrier-protein] synthase-3
MKAYIQGIGSYVPSKRVSNDDLSKIVETSDEWIFSHTGIKNRHIVDDSEAASDLGFYAAKQALEEAGRAASEIEMIITATATPDYLGFPSTACIIQEKLETERAAAMDITAACTGFIYGLETARAFIESGIYRTVLVVGTEALSRITNWKDRNTCVLFGDGAGAAVVTGTDEDRGVLASYLRSYGKDSGVLLRPAGGSRTPYKVGETPEEDLYIRMDGRKVYYFAVSVLGKTIKRLLEKTGMTIEEIDYIVPHQANVRIIEACAKRLGISLDKFYLNMDEFANTSAASIPIALTDMKNKGMLKKGDKIITVGFGGGLTYGGNLIRW